MAVAHSAASESHTGTTGSTNQTAFSWTHTQSGTPQGVVVFVHTISASDFITSVTYGGTALERVAGAVAVDATVEPGRTDMFFLGSGLATGNQTIAVNRTNNATVMYASAATVTAATDTTWAGVQVEEDNQALAPVAVDDGSLGVNSLRYAATYYGANSPAPAGTGSTLLTSIDLGSFGNSMVRETTAGQGARNVGFSASSDDVAAVYVAIRELVDRTETPIVGAFTLTGNAADLAVVSPKILEPVVGAFTLAGNDATALRGYVVEAATGALDLTGNDAQLAHQHKIAADTGTLALTGNDAVLAVVAAKDITAEVGTFALTGGSPQLRRTFALQANAGTFALVGNSAGLADTDRIDGQTGAFALTGGSPSLTRSYSLAADAGAIALVGNGVTLLHDQSLLVDAGSFSITGGAPALLRTYYLSGGAGGFIETGQAIIFSRTWELGADAGQLQLTGNPAALTTVGVFEIDPIVGSFALAGQQVGLAHDRNIAAEAGQLSLTGQPAEFSEGDALLADAASFLLTGDAAGLSRGYALSADTGSLSLSGQPAQFSKSRSLFPEAGAFSVTGNAITAARSYELAADAAAFALAGGSPSLTTVGVFAIDAGTGAFNLAGNSADARWDRRLLPDAGSAVLAGGDVDLDRSWIARPEVGEFALLGNNAVLTEEDRFELPVDAGAFSFTGNQAGLAKSGGGRRRNVLIF